MVLLLRLHSPEMLPNAQKLLQMRHRPQVYLPHKMAVVRDKNKPNFHRPLILCIGKYSVINAKVSIFLKRKIIYKLAPKSYCILNVNDHFTIRAALRFWAPTGGAKTIIPVSKK